MKNVSICLATVLVSQCLAIVAPAQTGASADGPVFDIPRLDNVKIDGNPSDWGRDGFRVDALADIAGPLPDTDDLDASFRLAWNACGLLVLVTVCDDKAVESDKDDQLWRADGIELYLSPSYGDRNVVQPIVSPGLDPNHPKLRTFVHDYRKDKKLMETPATIEVARTKTNDGYVVEVLIPWAPVGVTPEIGKTVGFQLYVNDMDDPADSGMNIYHDVWYPKYGAFANPRAMHILRLSDKAGTPVLVAARVSGPSNKGVEVVVNGPVNLVGSEALLVADGGELARAKFAKAGGRAVARPLVEMAGLKSSPTGLKVLIGDEVATTVHQRILPPPAPVEHPELLGSRIQRTMTLLATSNPWRRYPVRILCYGQSIIAGEWWHTFEADLRERFPYADLTVVNRSIGGFEAHNLVRTAEHDLYPFYPDLMVFHVYGGEKSGELERIISNTRRYTTAEIVIFTHQAPLPNTHFDYAADFTRRIAQKYNCELVEVREEWRKYLEDNDLKPEELLGGQQDVHPNSDGQRLLAALIGRHFQYNALLPGGWTDTIRTYEAKRALDEGADDEIVFTGKGWEQLPLGRGDKGADGVVGTDPDSSLKLIFKGNRVDVIAATAEGPFGTARVLIDGVPPSKHPGCYAITRPSSMPNTWWPAIRRVGHNAPLVEETWTLRVTEISDDYKQFKYDVSGSVTGPDGSGSSEGTFVSNSGRVVLEPRDFVFVHAHNIMRTVIEPGFEVHWKVAPMFKDIYTPPAAPEVVKDDRNGRRAFDNWATIVHQTKLAQGLTNGEHTLEIIPNGDGPVPIREIVVYCPPLRYCPRRPHAQNVKQHEQLIGGTCDE